STTTTYGGLALSVNGALSYTLSDGLGSVSEAVATSGASAGSVSATQLYAPYGAVRYQSGTLPGTRGYTGQRADAATGLDDYGARYYDPLAGQFISADTTLAGGLNRYAYVAGNPTTYIDPTGHEEWVGCEGEGAFISGGATSGDTGASDGSSGTGSAGGGSEASATSPTTDSPSESSSAPADSTSATSPLDPAGEGTGPGEVRANEEHLHEVEEQYPHSPDTATPSDTGNPSRGSSERGSGTGSTTTGSGRPTTSLKPSSIRYSQSSVNGASEIIASMQDNGWVGDPIDVVQMPDGNLTTVDNTRVVAANEAGIDVQAEIHPFDEPLPEDQVGRFTTRSGGAPSTWGEAIMNRIGSQNARFRTTYPYGSPFTTWNGS
ncbi:MAG TPA: RHS repeat-associated core domain-containing protein, partial [Chloroflexota bacterium]